MCQLRCFFWETRVIYSLRRLSSIDKINAADYFKLLSYLIQKYEFLTMSIEGGQTRNQTNPSYLAGWPLGLTTMSIVGGQRNTIQPSYVGGWPLSQLTIVCGFRYKQREVDLLKAAVYSMTLI